VQYTELSLYQYRITLFSSVCTADMQSVPVANTFSCLNIHCVFSTKERAPVLTPEIRERLWPYIGGIAKQNGIFPKCIGGVADHIHLLLSLPTTVAIAKAVQLIKAGSSSWVHQTFLELRNFAWQQGYGGVQRRYLADPGNDSIH
jgi:REP element-mobilizing transposase RayT